MRPRDSRGRCSEATVSDGGSATVFALAVGLFLAFWQWDVVAASRLVRQAQARQASQDGEGMRVALQQAVQLDPNEPAYRDLLARTYQLTPRVSGRTGTG